jgi:hypothetical protein
MTREEKREDAISKSQRRRRKKTCKRCCSGRKTSTIKTMKRASEGKAGAEFEEERVLGPVESRNSTFERRPPVSRLRAWKIPETRR